MNSLIWKRAPKIFVRKDIINMATCSAIITFNDGDGGLIEVLERAGLSFGYFTREGYCKVDRN